MDTRIDRCRSQGLLDKPGTLPSEFIQPDTAVLRKEAQDMLRDRIALARQFQIKDRVRTTDGTVAGRVTGINTKSGSVEIAIGTRLRKIYAADALEICTQKQK